MKSKQTILSILILFFLAPSITNAQDKLWSVNLKETLAQVGWIEQSNDGMIIAAGAKGLLALNNLSGKIVWHNKELKGVDRNSFLNIDGLPLFYVEYQPIVGKTAGMLINSSNGNVVYDTRDKGYRIKYFTVLIDQGVVLFELTQAKKRYLMSFSLKTWKENWVCSLGETNNLIQKLLKKSFINHGPYFNTNNDIIVGTKNQIFTINSKNGEIIWKHTAGKKIKALVYSNINNSLYMGIKKSKKLTLFDPITGKDITPAKLKLRGTLIDVRPDNDNNLILVETEGFNLIDPKTNEFKWKKSFKIAYLDEVIPHEKGYIAIGKDEKDGSVALVDPSGNKLWTSKVKGYIYYATPTNKGVMYISTERSNILDFDNGKDVWKRDVKFRSIPAVTYDDKQNKVILFENRKAYKFDLNTGAIELFAEDIKLANVKRSTPLLAEYIDNEGYLLYTEQHISLLSSDGKLKHTQYFFPATSIGGVAQSVEVGLAIAGVDLDITGSMENIEDLTAISRGAYRKSIDQNGGTSKTHVAAGLYIGDNQGNMAPIFEITKTRYFNSKNIKNHQFIVSKVKDPTAPTKHAIHMVNKKTGKIDKEISLLDKTPNYLIDEIDSVVFINEKNQLISAHKF